MVVHEDYTRVLAVPCDMEIAGYDTQQVNTLRLWDAKSPKPIDMKLFSEGQYLRAGEERAMADVISKVLYPEDNHYEGKSLRLKQQYFFVSATMQSITRQHIQTYGTLKNFHEKNVIQINDTHPALVIPELMRILVDDAGLCLGRGVAHYHLLRGLHQPHGPGGGAGALAPAAVRDAAAPRVADPAGDRPPLAARRWRASITTPKRPPRWRSSGTAWCGWPTSASPAVWPSTACPLCTRISCSHDVFRDACRMEPEKFKNVTNGMDHRRWLSQINPGLDGLIRELIGGRLSDSMPGPFAGAGRPMLRMRAVLARLEEIKRCNKETFAPGGPADSKACMLNTDAIFDVQVKRLHEYKRQLLNVLHIIALYQQLQDDPDMDFTTTDLPLWRQGRSRLCRSQAHHPSHQLSGGSGRTTTPSARGSCRWYFWRITGSPWRRC